MMEGEIMAIEEGRALLNIIEKQDSTWSQDIFSGLDKHCQ